MSWITIIWSGVAGISLALAGLQLLVWIKSRDGWPYLLFSVAALGGVCMAFIEMKLMQIQSVEEFIELWRLLHVSIFIILVALVWFTWFYLQAGRLWLAWLVTGFRGLVLILTFSLDPNLNFTEITGLRTILVFNETILIPIGEKNPWTNITHASAILFLIYLLDAAFSAWRYGDRRRAMVVGVTFGFAISAAVFFSEMINRGIIAFSLPYTFSLLFLIILIGVAYGLSQELVRANRLSRNLLESEARLGLATSSADIGVWDWDIGRDEVWVNDNIRRRMGLSDNQYLNFDAFLQQMHPYDREAIQQVVQNGFGNQEDFDLEYRAITANSEIHWIKARGRVEHDPSGKPLHLRGVSMDITERKNTEAELQERRRELAHATRVSTLGQLSSALAHEINQPLGAILRNTEAAELYLKQTPPDIEELKAILVDIRNDQKRAASVIERMRSLLKRGEMQFEPIAVEELIKQVAVLLRIEFQTRQATLDIDVPRSLPKVHGDRIHLQQVILNLLINALDALNGSTEVQRRIIIRASQASEGMVELAVIDQGMGIQPEKLPYLFEPFFTTKAKGTGIGLSISKTIVEMHGGRMMAENNTEAGAIIRFTLPVLQQGAPQ